jgi:GTPase SAR1 family protein
MLVGTKADLDSERKVSLEQAKAYADRLQLQYVETSSKDDKNVAEAFSLMANTIVSKLKADTIHEEPLAQRQIVRDLV